MEKKHEQVKEILKKYNQEHLLSFYNELTEYEKEDLLNEILEIDFEQINKLYQRSAERKTVANNLEPLKVVDKAKMPNEEKNELEVIGERIIKNGEFAVATMAGGQRNKIRT